MGHLTELDVAHAPTLAATHALASEPRVDQRLWILVVGIGALYVAFFIVTAGYVGPTDQDQFLVFHELQYWNAELFGLSKQWSPVMCSGLSLADEPQVPFLSLSMGLAYLLGPFWGIKVAAIAYFVIGWVGAHLYAGLWLRQSLQRALAAALFVGNGFFFCRVGAGHADFLPFLALPLVLWILHGSCAWQVSARDPRGLLGPLVTVAGLGAILSLTVDGSPVAMIHLWLWIALYAVVLAWSARALAPLGLLCAAVAVASMLDAGYLWPMLRAQQSFPRHTADRFTGPLNLLWFSLVPMRGKVLPANGLGHELSVFIGPVIAWAIWSHREWLGANVPQRVKGPLVIVSAVSIVLGMGSLLGLGVPRWLSPFDLLRSLPGFRSIGVTGRYWGFLALPLSLFGAAALCRFFAEPRSRRSLAWALGALLFFQLGFQGETLFGQWLGTRPYRSVPWKGRFQHGPERVTYLSRAKDTPQGAILSPTTAVENCYDMDDFQHAPVGSGTQLLRESTMRGAQAQFTRWGQIQLHAGSHDGMDLPRAQWTLNQAYHRNWRMPGCTVLRASHGNLVANCPADIVGPLPALTFYDRTSALAARVSVASWQSWAALLIGSLVAIWALQARRGLPQPQHASSGASAGR